MEFPPEQLEEEGAVSSQNWAASSKVRKNVDMTSKERGFWPKEEEKINFLFRSSFRALSEKNADLKKGGRYFVNLFP